ncbi:hypothetical protein TNCV_3034901 [Trichonephila clavipes]|nr:hypothetical protein TNCV_3034901 [Trichonephila clavipes]
MGLLTLAKAGAAQHTMNSAALTYLELHSTCINNKQSTVPPDHHWLLFPCMDHGERDSLPLTWLIGKIVALRATLAKPSLSVWMTTLVIPFWIWWKLRDNDSVLVSLTSGMASSRWLIGVIQFLGDGSEIKNSSRLEPELPCLLH